MIKSYLKKNTISPKQLVRVLGDIKLLIDMSV